MDLVVRDTLSGAAIPLGAADALERPVPLGLPNTRLECADGYLVVLDTPAAATAVNGIADRVATIVAEQAAAAEAIRAAVPAARIAGRTRTALNALHVRMPARAVARVRALGFEVWPNVEVRAALMDSVPLINADDVWTQNAGLFPVRGRGIQIAIIDTGVDYTHPDLGNGCFGLPPDPITGISPCKVVGGYDVVNGDTNPMDDHGHGTHVASIAAGDGTLDGVAPGAMLWGYKVLNQEGWGTTEQVVEGIDRAIDRNQNGSTDDSADILNLSLATPGSPTDPLSQAVDAAVLSGAVVVTAAGNATKNVLDERTIQSPGTALQAITVGSTAKQDFVSDFTSRGPVVWDGQAAMKPDVAAPGEQICGAQWSSYKPSQQCLDGDHVALNGTSMSAPHVAGTAALLLQAYPSITPEQVKSAIKGSAVTIPHPGSVAQIGSGRLEALGAYLQGPSPPVARLDPVPLTGSVRFLRGRVQASALKRWRVEYTEYKAAYVPEGTWNVLAESTTAPPGSLLHALQIKNLPDGKYLLRLTVEDQSGNRAIDHGYTEIEKIQISEPLPRDIERGGDPLEVKLSVDPTMTTPTYTLEYSSSPNPGPNDWTHAATGATPTLTWDTSGLPRGSYTLRVLVAHDGLTEEEQVAVKLDPALHPGWPVRVPLSDGATCGAFTPPCPIRTGWIDPTVADLEGDGSSETLVVRYTPKLEVRAYRADGSLAWTTPLGSAANPDPSFFWAFQLVHTPVIGDTDDDGVLEVYAYNPLDQQVYVLRPDGSVATTWKLPTTVVQGWTRLMLADVDANGSEELIVSFNIIDPEIIVVRTSDGAVISEFSVRQQSPQSTYFFSVDYTYAPAAGQLDADAQLEIVAVDDSQGRIHAFDWDGTLLWSYQGKQADPYIPPVVGDLDGDGDDEVVAALRGHGGSPAFQVLALQGSGLMLPGWPIERKSEGLRGGLTLADLDGDDDLEVAVNATGGQTFAYHHTGSPLAGWPTKATLGVAAPPVVGDVDGDGMPDVVTHEWSMNDGMISARSRDGAALPGFGNPVEHSQRAPVAIGQLTAGGPAVLFASSDGDNYKAVGSNTTISKRRMSIYAWDLPVAYDPAAMPWPMLQHDLRRTGNYDGAVPGSGGIIGPTPSVTVNLNAPAPACCVPPLKQAVKDNDQLTWTVSATQQNASGQPVPCSGCTVQEVLLRQYALSDCVNPTGDKAIGGGSWHGAFDPGAAAIQLAATVRNEAGVTGTGLSGCLLVDNARPQITSAVASEDRRNVSVNFSERVSMSEFVPGDWLVEDGLGPNPATPNLLSSSDACFQTVGCTRLTLVFERALTPGNLGTLSYEPSLITRKRPFDRVALTLPSTVIGVSCGSCES